MKYVLVTGGVVSGLGKGITSSSIGLLLKETGLRVTSIKIDPYLNIDAGTMSPYEHGEVFVLDDGGEADLDLGNYERFMNITLTRDHNITTGKIYIQVLDRERKGDYLGKTVQVVPHITDAIQGWIERVARIPVDGSNKIPDVCMIELGGTVGDIESMVFLEALRQFRYKCGADNFCHVHVSLVPVVGAVGEPKSKPTQHGIKELRSAGLSPDVIVCRSSNPLSRSIISKISLFCMVPASNVVGIHDVSNLYRVPGLMLAQRLPGTILTSLRINRMPPESLPVWERMAETVDNAPKTVKIAIVGKYTGLSDSYLSVTKALLHGAMDANLKLNLIWIESTHLESPLVEEKDEKANKEHKAAWAALRDADGLLIPGAFGNRGINGKVLAVKYARENKIPFFGVCMGMQVAVIEYSRHVLDFKDANSTECDDQSSDPVVIFMPEISTTQMGGTMRLGARKTLIQEGTLASQLYDGASEIHERHRHRYEVNPEYIERLERAGLVFSGRADRDTRMEITELPDHPFFIGVQYHPEFKSRPNNPHPIFKGFIRASAKVFKREHPMPAAVSKKRKLSPSPGPEDQHSPKALKAVSE